MEDCSHKASTVAIPPAYDKRTEVFQGASASLRRPPWQRYAIAIAITALVTLIRYELDHILSDTTIYPLYFASVILAAWYCGLGPSILNVALGAAIASYYFADPRGSFIVSGLRHRIGLVIFCAVSGYLACLIHWLNRDIARRKQVESDLRASQKQLELHQIELAHMSRLSIMGEMVASLAHELNQPLHAAKNYARGSIRRMLKNPQLRRRVVGGPGAHWRTKPTCGGNPPPGPRLRAENRALRFGNLVERTGPGRGDDQRP